MLRGPTILRHSTSYHRFDVVFLLLCPARDLCSKEGSDGGILLWALCSLRQTSATLKTFLSKYMILNIYNIWIYELTRLSSLSAPSGPSLWWRTDTADSAATSMISSVWEQKVWVGSITAREPNGWSPETKVRSWTGFRAVCPVSVQRCL